MEKIFLNLTFLKKISSIYKIESFSNKITSEIPFKSHRNPITPITPRSRMRAISYNYNDYDAIKISQTYLDFTFRKMLFSNPHVRWFAYIKLQSVDG
jgi:hypothetical protein